MQKYVLSFVIAFALCCLFIAVILPLLRKFKAGQEILCYVTEHGNKAGTPTMMGIAIVLAICACTFLLSDFNSKLAVLTVLVGVAYAVVGFLDDYIKLKYKHNQGLKAYQKIIAQLSIAIVVALFVYKGGYADNLTIPFANVKVSLGWVSITFIIVIFLATTNGVNLTDGLDGLAGSVTLVYMLFMAVFVYFEKRTAESNGNSLLSYEYDNLIILCLIVAGSLLAFLIINVFPAKAFMGDVGSLSLGGLVACVSIFSGLSLYILILGVVYVWTCLSVIIQVGYFKVTKGKRVFLMAPYHHHLQQKGLSECRIVAIYTAATIMAGCLLLYFGVKAT